MEADPASADAVAGWGIISYRQGRQRRPAPYFARARALDPNSLMVRALDATCGEGRADAQLTVGTATGIGEYVRGLARRLAARGRRLRRTRAPALDPWRFDRRVIWDQAIAAAGARAAGESPALHRGHRSVFHARAGRGDRP